MTGVPEPTSADGPAGDGAMTGLRRRARMLLPVTVPLMIYLLIRIGDSSRVALGAAGVLLAVVAVASVVLVRRRGAEEARG
jgi:hypothetical protein